MNPLLIIFDVDKTLCRSKEPLSVEMAEALAQLLVQKRVAIISGDSLSLIEQNVLAQLPEDAHIEHLALLPTSGAMLYAWINHGWHEVYAEKIARDDIGKIEAAIQDACSETNLIDVSSPSYGERVEYRGAQITLSALGQQAPIAEKEAWDPDGNKKRVLRDAIARRLPEYDVKTGGSTSIDITKRGINKAYGLRRLSEYLSIPIGTMLYVGDALYTDGNDEVVKGTGITTQQISGPDDTLHVIRRLLAN